MQVTVASRRSPETTSNEDFIAATAGVVVVIDGASVPAGLGTGCIHGTAWFARRLGSRLLALLTTQADRSPADSLARRSPTWAPSTPTPAASTIQAAHWQPSFLDVLAEQGPDAIIRQVRAAEASDPDGRRWPRGKRHDDASAAYLVVDR
jgi:hypothetical protein